MPPHSFQPVTSAHAPTAGASPTASRSRTSRTRISTTASSTIASCDALMRAVDDVNAIDPQPDFVLYGGDLAQLGKPEELELGAQILKSVKAPVQDDGRRARLVPRHGREVARAVRPADLLVRPQGRALRRADERHREGLLDRAQDDARERMQTVAGLDNGMQSRFEVGDEQRAWLAERSREGRALRRRCSSSRTRRSTSTTATGTSGPRTPTRCRRS